MPSRERRLLDKDKEIRKLKCNLGHYFTNSVVLGVKNEILKQQLKIATDALNKIKTLDDNGNYDIEDYDCQVARITQEALEQITALEQKDVK